MGDKFWDYREKSLVFIKDKISFIKINRAIGITKKTRGLNSQAPSVSPCNNRETALVIPDEYGLKLKSDSYIERTGK